MTEPKDEMPAAARLLDEALEHAQALCQITGEQYPQFDDAQGYLDNVFRIAVGCIYTAAALRTASANNVDPAALAARYSEILAYAPSSLCASLADIMDFLPVEGDPTHMIARTIRRVVIGSERNFEEAVARLTACVAILKNAVSEDSTERVARRARDLALATQQNGRVQIFRMSKGGDS